MKRTQTGWGTTMVTRKMVIKAENIRYDLEGDLKTVIDFLTKKYSEYPEAYIDISAYEEYGSPTAEVTLNYKELETEEGAVAREEREAKYSKERAEWDYKQYKQLKAKFEKENN